MNIVKLREENIPGAKLPDEPGKCSILQLERWLECPVGTRSKTDGGGRPKIGQKIFSGEKYVKKTHLQE